MPVPSIWNLRPLEREAETREFTDPEQPDWRLSLTLRPVDGVTGTRYAVLKVDLLRQHVTGLIGPDGELIKGPDKKPLQEPEPVRCGDFQKRFPDEFVVDRYAKMVAMWADPEEGPPPLSEVVGWQALLYQGWFEIANWIEDLYRRQPEVKGGTMEASSAASLTSTESTPSEPNEPTPSNVPRNGHSGKLPGECGQLSGCLQENDSEPVPN